MSLNALSLVPDLTRGGLDCAQCGSALHSRVQAGTVTLAIAKGLRVVLVVRLSRSGVTLETDRLLVGLYWSTKLWMRRWHRCKERDCQFVAEFGPFSLTRARSGVA